MTPDLHISMCEPISGRLPDLRLGCMVFDVHIKPAPATLLHLMESTVDEIRSSIVMEDVGELPAIHAAKTAYRALGKDPSRYRPSAEALTRRVVAGKGLFHINNVIDTLNLLSLRHGFSIGGYDHHTIEGPVELCVGRSGEPYEAIGRGQLNIENLPVLRDSRGAFGSPTSDSMRTRVTGQTTVFFMVIFDFGGWEQLEACMEASGRMMHTYAGATHISSMVL